jgi:hypothetical protein
LKKCIILFSNYKKKKKSFLNIYFLLWNDLNDIFSNLMFLHVTLNWLNLAKIIIIIYN